MAKSNLIREKNMTAVVRYIYSGGVCSKQDIAYGLKMSFPTVNQNITTLMEQGLVKETGMLKSTGGRKAVGIQFDAESRYAIGVDLARHHLTMVATNLRGEVIKQSHLQKTFSKENQYFKDLGDIIDSFVLEANIAPDRLLGVGISVPAIVSENRMLLSYSTVLGSAGITLYDFSRYIHFPCVLCNDAKAAATAEIWNNEYAQDVVYISLNNSVGGAIVKNGEALMGYHCRSAEFGHTKLIPNGRRCYCGQKGCVDAYCNAMILSDLDNGKLEDFFSALEKNEPKHRQVWDEYLDYLAIVVNNLRMSFDCDVVVGGYVGTFIGPYLQDLQARVRQLNTFESSGDYVHACRRKAEATAVGAALAHIKPFLDNIK